ncbi:putative glutamate receptor ionotropic, kainate 2 [Penaeus vannamei]|uniref:Putative glutamate receptor ionotropic, kainate 2 n=1 Tax=Penaeus vannamei TaxID=6689 RepID=A0A3R7QVI0_PENVA|nr:putative glutamate receptor ionotropic, kainate 2 [Penaeus vannamei]
MYILARFTPYEWQNPHPCDPDPDTLENQFTILNCLWFAIGSLMQQGCDFLPQAVSTRMVAGMWWFFTLIMISSYTANLAAFLTVERMDSPIESAEDLAKQTKIKYGSLKTGSTMAFFRDSKIPTYQGMWATMMRHEDPGPSESNGLYAYLMESTSIEYVVERQCDLTQIGGLLDSKSYGIALPPGSPYTSAISSAILSLQETSKIQMLKRRWWKEKNRSDKCAKEKEEAGGSSMASELNLSNVGGVFVVLLGGMGLALVVALAEFVLECWDISKEDEKSIISVLNVASASDVTVDHHPDQWPIPSYVPPPSPVANLNASTVNQNTSTLSQNSSTVASQNFSSSPFFTPDRKPSLSPATDQGEDLLEAEGVRQRKKNW